MSTLKVDAIRHNSATSDAITTAADGTCTAKITGMTGGGGLSHRNKIINGAMTVSQRHGTTVVTGVNSNGYRIDRWTHQCASINSAFSVSQSTDSPDGFGNSYKIDVTTADTSLAAAHAHFFRQKIEGQNLQDFAKGTSSAKQFALSFYVKTNKTGVYTVEMYDIDNNRAISKTFTVADSNWNRYTIIFPADTTGAFDNDNGNSLVVQFFLSAGSNYTNNGTFNNSAWGSLSGKSRVSSSNVNFADSTSNNWYLTGVQLEVGDTATSFEHRSFEEEEDRCMRYYEEGSFSFRASGNIVRYCQAFNKRKRANPSMKVYYDSNKATDGTINSGNSNNSGWSRNATGKNAFNIEKNTGSNGNGVDFAGYYTAESEL